MTNSASCLQAIFGFGSIAASKPDQNLSELSAMLFFTNPFTEKGKEHL